MNPLKYFPLYILISVLTGCATIVDGSDQNVTIDSNPQGAKVYIGKMEDGKIVGKASAGVTPTTVNISRRNGAVIIEKDGYKSETINLKRKMNGWVLGDILLTSPLSTSIDTSTGAANEYDPDKYFVELKQSQ